MWRETPEILAPEAVGPFADEARRAVYQAIALRRDIRHFRSEAEVSDELLERVLGAAHLAPSVGFSQPWRFIDIRGRAVRERIRQSFLACREAEARRFPPQRREQYLSHKLEGILEAPVNVCVAVDLRDRGGAILGTTAQPEAVRASACCAVQNLWLAARAEGLGVGWVSIVEPAVLRAELALPAGVEPVAYLCVGFPVAFRNRPLLEETRWEKRLPLAEVIHREHFRPEPKPDSAPEPPISPPVGPIAPFSQEAREAAISHQATLTKPAGSLGRLEELAAWYAGARGRFPPPPLHRCALAVFAGDHGVAAEGVSAYGSPVTAAMVANIMAGGAAINAIARSSQVELTLVDVGVAGDLSAVPAEPLVPLVRAKVRAGTANLRREPAMTRAEAQAALQVGAKLARELAGSGADLLGVGELGIGNTTSAAALVRTFTGKEPVAAVGRGTGLSGAALERKVAVVEEALRLHRPDPDDPIGVLAALGGLELAAMAGFMLEGARRRIPVVLDGFLADAAALAARAMGRGVLPYLLASHASAEAGARAALTLLDLEPLLDFGMRLGEGTGAALAMATVRAAVATQSSMANFSTAGIVGRSGFPAQRGEAP